MSTAIQWCDETWNPSVGCSRVSSGCDHCYAIGVAARQMSPQHRGLTKVRPKSASRPGPDWTGEVRKVPAMLARPLHWRNPRRVFVNSMSDLFHSQVPFEFIAAVFGVMAACPQHTFLVLTKRPERAREFFEWITVRAAMEDVPLGRQRSEIDVGAEELFEAASLAIGDEYLKRPWPLPNVHLGVSVEDQATADERIPVLLNCPARLHWASYEPALGPVDFVTANAKRYIGCPQLRWVIVGGESGPGARAFDIDWARSTVAQCLAAGVPVFVKQLGARPIRRRPLAGALQSEFMAVDLADRKGGDISEWPADLRVRQYPE